MALSLYCSVGAVSLAILSAVSGANAASAYTIQDTYAGSNFFNMWQFSTDNDPTHGYVNYVSQSTAANEGLIAFSPKTGQNYMGVDYKTNLTGTNVRGRDSVRLTSNNAYTHGLFVADIAHMPAPSCGIWPAFWTVGPNWPNSGEIDIIENVNQQQVNLETLHTAKGCTVTGNSQTATQNSFDCDTFSTANGQSSGAGCSAQNSDSTSWGDGFNNAKGGVYAMEWTSSHIYIWQWPRASIPSDITSGNPNPSSWGTPSFNGTLSCNIDSYFQQHQIVFDTTFCGDYAGNDYFWKQTSCYDAKKYPTCGSYVAANPSAFQNAYWLVNSVKVYQQPNTTSSSLPSTTTITTTVKTTTTTHITVTKSSSSIPSSSSIKSSSTSSTRSSSFTTTTKASSNIKSSSTSSTKSSSKTTTAKASYSTTSTRSPSMTTITKSSTTGTKLKTSTSSSKSANKPTSSTSKPTSTTTSKPSATQGNIKAISTSKSSATKPSSNLLSKLLS